MKTRVQSPKSMVLLVLVLCWMLGESTQEITTIQLQDNIQQQRNLVLKKKKTIKVEMEDAVRTLLESDEKRLFWAFRAREALRVTLSASKNPQPEDPVLTQELAKGRRLIFQFSKFVNQEIFSAIRDKGHFYLIVERQGIGLSDEARDLRVDFLF